MSNGYALHYQDNQTMTVFMPPASYLVRAGATGAMLAGGWTAYSAVPKVRAREATRDEAVRNTVTNAAIGAGAGVVIGAAAHVARAHPLVGLTAVLAAGVGALYLAGGGKADAEATDTTGRTRGTAKPAGKTKRA